MPTKKSPRRTLREVKPPWRETALDHWSKDVDPYVMSGDMYTDDRDPGFARRENQEIAKGLKDGINPPFMHPTKDVTYRNE